jgi:hypothetical protein
MDTRKIKFVAALLVFLAWVATLGAMAVRSSRRPADRPGVVAPP